MPPESLMLGRTAQNLFWLSRYIERAENMARMLEVGYRMSLTSRREGGASEHLMSMMQAAEVDEEFNKKHKLADVATVSHFMLFDEDNLSSVRACLTAARTNARSVRTALTSDVWETINSAYLEFSQLTPRDVTGGRLTELLQWVKQVSHQYRGALLSTILRDDGYAFSQIGNFVERADNTARILDVKYYVLLPSVAWVGSTLDNSQWESILRSVSAHRSYRWVYEADYRPTNIADYLILNPRMPRSLTFCYRFLAEHLKFREQEYGTRLSCHDTVEETLARLKVGSIKDIFDFGLHEFLTNFIRDNYRLGDEVASDYRFQ